MTLEMELVGMRAVMIAGGIGAAIGVGDSPGGTNSTCADIASATSCNDVCSMIGKLVRVASNGAKCSSNATIGNQLLLGYTNGWDFGWHADESKFGVGIIDYLNSTFLPNFILPPAHLTISSSRSLSMTPCG
jgi:hypothetical protein